MDNLDQLSDNELRHRLLQYGFPNLPVTNTTRKILIKKLRNHVNNEKMKLRRDTKFISRYSSDEESDIDAKNRKSKFSATSLPISSTAITSSSVNNQRSILFNSNSAVPSAPTITRRITSLSPNTGSDTGTAGTRSSVHNNYPSTSATSSMSKQQQQQQSTKSRIYIPQPIISFDSDEDSNYCNKKSFNISPYSRIKRPPSPSQLMQGATTNFYSSDRSLSDRSCDSQSRYSPVSSSYTSNMVSDLQSPTPNGHNSSKDSHYLSDFTRRLLSLRGETIRDSIYNKNFTRPRISTSSSSSIPDYHQLSSVSPDPTEIVHQQPEPKSEYNISPSLAFSNLINRLDEQYGVKQTLIPCVLLSILVIFFTLVAFMYMTISPDLANTISRKNTIYVICQSDSLNSEFSIINKSTTTNNCIEQEYIEDALELLKIIAPELQKRAEINQCFDKSWPSAMSAREAISLVQQNNPAIDVRKTIKNLHNLEYLIENNPQWKIIHVDAEGNKLSFDKVIQLRVTQANHFIVKNPKLPFTCAVYNELQKFFFYIGSGGILLVIIAVFYFIYKIFSNYQQSKRDTVVYFIDEIINALMRTAATSPDRSVVVINHLRDKIIPLHQRKKLEWAWNEAIKFLEQNESRIQFDVGIKNGEEVKLMKWIDTISPEHIGQRSQIKKWHSPAFDKTNKIANPPTPCLKIRQMFDKFEANNPNLKTIIQDAILEKVGPNCKIYDIQLDKATCCVYVRCASVKDAGIVHNEINGWWFDKRLVSIKFLRLERYLNRFPKSSSGPTCLRPSNTKNLSMSQCSAGDYNSSMNEMEDGIDEDNDDDDDDN